MRVLLAFSRGIDFLSENVGLAVRWLVLLVVLVSSVNATVRYALNESSNGWLELQWYLYSAIFLLTSAYTLQRNEHVRIDILASRFPHRVQVWIDIFGTLFFLLPIAILIMYLSWPMFIQSYLQHEGSPNAGGLLRWPVKLLVPVAFALLALQGVSELIKRIAHLMGLIPDPAIKPDGPHGMPPGEL